MSIEEALWASADKMRGSVEYPVYKQVVLGLVFLKFVNERFEKRRAEIIAEGKEDRIEMPFAYTMKNVFYLPEDARWTFIVEEAAKQSDVKNKLDKAMALIENSNESLKGALPSNFYSTVDLNNTNIASLIDIMDSVDLTKDEEEDIIGRVYEYFLAKFSSKEGKGEFYTPKPIVKIITEMIQPLKGRIFDPCCGSGGMFVQSMKLVQAHHGNKSDVSIYGQEYTLTTLKLAKMNLAIRGISANFGPHNDDSLRRDLHKDLRADFVMANPPFNQDEWGAGEMDRDPRWVYGIPRGNANYAWIQHFLYHLNDNGVAGFVMANGSLTSSSNGDDDIRKNMVDRLVVKEGIQKRLTDSLEAEDIAYYHTNSAGQVDVILLENVTGSCYAYGKITRYSAEEGINLGSGSMNAYNPAATLTNSAGRSEKYLCAISSSSDRYVGIALTPSSSGYEREPCAALKLNPACRSGLTVRRDFPHDNLFHTLMGLMQVTSSEYDPRLDLTAQCPL